MVSGLGRDQVLGIPVVSSCMAPPSITDIEEGVPIVARAPARPMSASKGARARDRGVFCYPSTHNSLSRQTFRSPQLSRVAQQAGECGRDPRTPPRCRGRGPRRPVELLVWCGKGMMAIYMVVQDRPARSSLVQ